ncbi:MAG: hypothetical protein AAGJ87_08265 [Pseudomonadota bacterium]
MQWGIDTRSLAGARRSAGSGAVGRDIVARRGGPDYYNGGYQ